MYRKPIDRGQAARYRKYVGSHGCGEQGASSAADAGAEAGCILPRVTFTISTRFLRI